MGSTSEKKTKKAPPSKKQKAVKRSRANKKALKTSANVESGVGKPAKANKTNGIRLLKNTVSAKQSSAKVDATSSQGARENPGVSGTKKTKKEKLKCAPGSRPSSAGKALSDSSTLKSKQEKVDICPVTVSLVNPKSRITAAKYSKSSNKSAVKGTSSATPNLSPFTSKSGNLKTSDIGQPHLGKKSLTENDECGIQPCSLAGKLAPLKMVQSKVKEVVPRCPVGPVGNVEQMNSRNSKVKGIAVFNPALAYTSTVVTMTNNMHTIKQHSSKSKNSSPRELHDLINNVHKGEQQITKAFAVAGQDAADNNQHTSPKDPETPAADWNEGENNLESQDSESGCLREVADCFSSTSCNSKNSLQSDSCIILSRDRKSPCNGESIDCTGVHNTSATANTMDTLTNQQLNSYARLLWLSEKSPLESESGKKGKQRNWNCLTNREKQPFIQRARLAMSEPVLAKSTQRTVQQDEQNGIVKTRKRAKTMTLGKIKISKRSTETKSIKPKSGDLVLTVTHPTIAPAPITPVSTATKSSTALAIASHCTTPDRSQPIVPDKLDTKKNKAKKGSVGYTHHIKEDYNGCQQAQRFYSMPGVVQKLYLERELFECRSVMSNSQCKTMLNDYKDEYTEVRRTFIAANNLMSSRTKKENLEIIQRSILYSKIQHHKQLAFTARMCPFPAMEPSNQHTDFHGLIDYIIETGVNPPIMYPTYSSELTLVLDVLESVPAHHISEQALPLTARKSNSYMSIMNSLLSTEQGIDVDTAANFTNSTLSEFDIPLLLSLSDSSIDLHLDS